MPPGCQGGENLDSDYKKMYNYLWEKIEFDIWQQVFI
ncbi:hypothetical protein P378_09795 [Desulforamulus profundi]|uniref:Uncharacterized protein n=1 Tax=Desulforamulus profundi TaxID=1383067 RepID=A0A2C6MBB2_9FIRM|nr:hypothetical protein P378_09795 [Desulforamulus profundi]